VAIFPKWEARVQVATSAELEAWKARTGWNPFDLTKVWPHADFPRHSVGIFELNRNPDNYHADVEQVAFSPSNVVPGMSYSPDKMSQGRLFGYHDAQLYRVGTNHQHLPVNSPRCPFHNQQRDGQMAGVGKFANGGAAQNYATVEATGTPRQGLGFGDAGYPVHGNIGRFDGRGHEDDCTQAGNLYRLLPADENERLTSNIADAMQSVSTEIKLRQIGHFSKADAAYGAAVKTKLGM
jgi:catalase